jgi:hypothetical protein
MRYPARSHVRVLHPATSFCSGGRCRAIPGLVLAELGAAWVLSGAGKVTVAEEPARERPFRALTPGP